MANSDAADVRKAARAVLLLDHEGDSREALARADALALDHPESALALRLAADLHYAAAIRARRSAGWEEQQPEEGSGAAAAAAEAHLLSARTALSACKRLVPDCVDIATALGDAFGDSMLYGEAEGEYRRALGISLPIDPAVHNVAYGLYGPEPSTVNERVQEAREKARLAYDRLTKQLIAIGVERVLDIGKRDGAVEALRHAKRVAERFPDSPRSQYLRGYMDLEFVRSLDPAIDKRALLRRTLIIADSAANTFPNSVVIASFRAKLLFVLGEYDAAERECRRALDMKNPDDPEEDSIPPGSISGPNHGARLVSLAAELHELNLKIFMAASDYWESMTTKRRRDFLSVRLDALQEDYNKVDQSSEFTILGVQSFVKEHKSWRFWVCPICDSRKYMDTGSLLSHMCSKHPRSVLPSLQSVLDPKLTLEGDDSLDGLIFCQDSDQQDIVRFKKRNDMFKWLFNAPSSGIRAKPFAEIRKNNCKNGTFSLENIKKKLGTLPADKSSTKYAEALPEIQESWLNFVKASVLDYREVILTLARSFLWRKLKKCMTEDPKVATKRISAADIDAIFATVADNPVSSAVEEQTKKMDHKREDDQQITEAQKSSHPNQALKINENHQESEILVEDRKSGAMVNQKSSDPPIDMDENRMKLAAKLVNVELDAKCDSSISTSFPSTSDHNYSTRLEYQSSSENTASHSLETTGQSAEEISSSSSYQRSVDVLNKINADEDLFILHVIIQSLWNLRHFRDRFLRGPPVWILPIHDNPCIAEVFYDIFSAWEKNEHHRMAVLLSSVKTTLCKNVNDSSMFQKLQVGKNFASEIVATFLKGLHMSETCLHFDFNSEIGRQVVNPISCGDCICRTHNLFGIKFHVQMSCRCGKCFDEKEHTTIIHKLQAGSPQTTKIKSFAELPVLWDEQLFCKDNCEHCGSQKNIDLFLSNTPHFFTIVLWLGVCESQVTLSELLAGITSPLDIKLLYKGVHTTTNYTLASMICYADWRYVCFARDQDKWLIYDAKTVETEDTWEHLLERFRDCKLQPEVLFFEVIK